MAVQHELVGGLLVAFVDEMGSDLIVDLYGGYEPLCCAVRCTVPDSAERDDYRRIFDRWAANDTAVTFVHDPQRATFIEERQRWAKAKYRRWLNNAITRSLLPDQD